MLQGIACCLSDAVHGDRLQPVCGGHGFDALWGTLRDDDEVVEAARRSAEVRAGEVIRHHEALASVAGRKRVADDAGDGEVDNAGLRLHGKLCADGPTRGGGQRLRSEKLWAVLERRKGGLTVGRQHVEPSARLVYRWIDGRDRKGRSR